MYDLIGDIHGHADELIQMLKHLGYRVSNETYSHPERKVIFLGDFIDRGPQIRLVLKTVRDMVEGGHAFAVMGNHELNALAYHAKDRDRPGQFLRVHDDSDTGVKNTDQHKATLEQFKDAPSELKEYLEWFRKLPLWLDRDGIRVVHACWDDDAVATIMKMHRGQLIDDDFLHSACGKDAPLFEPVELLLKGREALLPDGHSFTDKDGHVRTSIRTRWYRTPSPSEETYGSYGLYSPPVDCTVRLDANAEAAARPYPVTAKPVFVGHYWLSATRPELLADNVACLDYSVAKGGFLCVYRWQGEKKLTAANFVHPDSCRTRFEQVLAKVPHDEPEPGDRLEQ